MDPVKPNIARQKKKEERKLMLSLAPHILSPPMTYVGKPLPPSSKTTFSDCYWKLRCRKEKRQRRYSTFTPSIYGETKSIFIAKCQSFHSTTHSDSENLFPKLPNRQHPRLTIIEYKQES